MTTNVAAGDQINFVTNRRGNTYWDSTGFDPTITFTADGSTGPASSNGRLDPLNRTGGTGEDPLSRNFNWSVPLVSLPGRSGLDLGLSLSYNSLVWTKTGSTISFDEDHGFPSPGFRLGFPVIQPAYFNAEVGKYACLLITPNGERIELRQVGSSGLYEAADSSHLLLDTLASPAMILRTTDGTQLSYELKGGEYRCTKIKDRNGNFITITYDTLGRIATVIDTLWRTINFNYVGNDLESITQSWQSVTHYWARFTYADLTVQTNFFNLTVVGPQNNSVLRVLTKVKFDDDSYNAFLYTSWGQVWMITNQAASGTLLNYRSYNLPLDNIPEKTDCPRFTQRHDWAKNWNRDQNGNEQEATTGFTAPVSATWTPPNSPQEIGLRANVTMPDNSTRQTIYFNGTAAASGWHRGLASMVETYSGNNLQRRSVTKWTQDNTGVSYPLNPRVEETNVYDPSGNRRRTTITYTSFAIPQGANYNLPTDTFEYADATTVLRHVQTDYRMDASTDSDYLNRHILGLVKEQRLYENAGIGTLRSRVGFTYDQSAIQGNDAPVQHETAYNSSFTIGRANLTHVKRYDVVTEQPLTSTMQYNTAGSVVETADAASHVVKISYTDEFARIGTTLDSALSFATLAYPSKVTNADNYSSSTRYHYDFGAPTWKQTPLPNVTTNTVGPIEILSYDSNGRLRQINNSVNSAYQRFIYGPNYVESFASVNSASMNNDTDEGHALQVFDGFGRVIASASVHTSNSFSGQLIHYDVMGRAVKKSNPTETSFSITGAPILPYAWPATGDDASAGWVYTQQTYDWKGRPLVTTNPSVTSNPAETTTKVASYSGCGCTGGEVMTLTDEVGRRQKVYSDVLGRTAKTEVLNWNGTVYSYITSTYDARDQATVVRQYDAATGGLSGDDDDL